MSDLFDDDVSEFTWIDPEAIHLVSSPATGISPLVAKSQAPKGKKHMSKKALKKAAMKAVAKAAEAGVTSVSPTVAAAALAGAFSKMERAIKSAEDDGEHGRARDLRGQLLLEKLQVAEQGRQHNPALAGRAKWGLGVPLFGNRRSLPDDTAVGGI